MSAFDLDRIGGRRALDALVDVVVEAGDEARRMFERGQAHAETKPDRTPVTLADKMVEDRIRAFLAQAHPSAGFLGEETGASGPSGGALRFVLDPIDGTRAFVRGLDTWSVLCGLEADGEPALGIAYMPAARDLFVGVIGGGVYDGGRPCRVSRVATLADATLTHGVVAQFTDSGLGALLPRLAERASTRGLSDFDGYRQVLRGRVDAMIDPGVKAWDLCAPAVLVREAGGRFTDFSGADTIHGGSGLASNGAIHAELLALLAG